MQRERPILFSAPMVRAIFEGRKTQTRRVIKPQPERCERTGFVTTGKRGTRWATGIGFDEAGTRRNFAYRCPYGRPGDRLWVREVFRIGEDLGAEWEPWMSTGDRFVAYDSTPEEKYCVPENYVIPRNAREHHNSEGTDEHWRCFGPISPIHMPRWASRITLEVTGVRVERLQDISEADCLSEGIEPVGKPVRMTTGATLQVGKIGGRYSTARALYRQLWESINGPGSWDANPWVWVIEFKRVEDESAAA